MTKRVLFSILFILAVGFGISLAVIFQSASGGGESTKNSLQENSTVSQSSDISAVTAADTQTNQTPEEVESIVTDHLEAVVVSDPNLFTTNDQSADNTQQFAIVWNSDIDAVSDARLICSDPQGQEMIIAETNRTSEAILFEKDFSDAAEGTYQLVSMNYAVEGANEEKTLVFDDAQIDADFQVTKENNETEQSAASIAVTDLNNCEEEVANGVTEILQKASDQNTMTVNASASDPLIVVIEAGHGGSDSGACAFGVEEKDLNLKIAQYCKDELETYENVVVYMVRTGDTNTTADDVINFATSKNPDILVSIHNNAFNGEAYGVEVFYPNSNYRSDLSTVGAGVSQKILDQLVALGLSSRGIKTRDYPGLTYPDGSTADWDYINRMSKENGYLGIVIEHAFMDNAGDYEAFLSSDEKLQKLGIADATGIANYYQLTKKSDPVTVYHEITGVSDITADQLVSYYTGMGKTYPAFYKKSDAPTLKKFCELYVEEAKKENINVAVAFCQAMKETGWLNYGGRVQIEQYNFGGLGATDGGATGASFETVRLGIRAQIQHLKAYANTEDLNEACVDPRFGLVTRGSAMYVEWLGQKENPNGKGWATAQNYGYTIVEMMSELQ